MKKIYTSSIFVNFANFANFAKFANFANFATGYFARVAALLLMLITMSVGEVWADWYFTGTMNSWPEYPSDATYKFTGNPLTCTLSLQAQEYSFKITSGGWANAHGANSSETMALNTPFYVKPDGNQGANIKFTPSVAGDYTFTLVTSSSPWSLKVVLAVSPDPEPSCEETVLRIYSEDGIPNLYIWGSVGVTGNGDSWPGNAMTAIVGKSNWYQYELGKTPTSGNFIVNVPEHGQTGNLTWGEGAEKYSPCICYQYSSSSLTIKECPTPCTAPAGGSISGTTSYTEGQNISLTASVTAGDNLSYQWKKDGVDMGGETSATLTISSCTMSDAATYSCVISNSCGSVAPVQAITVSAAPTYCRLYYSNPNSWGAVYAYVWKGGAEKSAWPGDDISDAYETINDVNYYYIDVDASVYENLIFNNGDGSQTGDLDISEHCNKYYNGTSWEPLPTPEVTYTVNVNDGAHGTVSPNGAQTVGAAGLDLSVSPATGYNHTDWDVTGGASVNGSNKLTATADGTATATYTPISYSITYANMDGATNYDGAPANYTIESATIVLGSPTKDGSTFTGWKRTDAGGAPVTQIETGSTGNVTLWATWDEGCVPSSFALYNDNYKGVGKPKIADFVATGTLNQYSLEFELINDIINGLYVMDNCGNKYGCSTAIEPGQTIILTTASSTFNFQSAAQDKHWEFTFNSTTKELTSGSKTVEDQTHTITVVGAENCTVTGKADSYREGAAVSFTIAPNSGYSITNVAISHAGLSANEADGVYTISGTMPTANVTVTVTVTGSEDLRTGWFLVGDMNSWNTSANEFMKKAGEAAGTVGYVEIALTEDKVFKIYNDGTYYANSDAATTMSRANSTNWVFSTTTGMDNTTKVSVDVAGTYIFKLDYSTKKVSVTYPAEPDPTITFGATTASTSYGSVTAKVDGEAISSGSSFAKNTVVTLTATPNSGHYLSGWYSDAAGNTLLAYATMASNYEYQVTLDGNKSVYAKFEEIPNGLKLDGQINGRAWDNCLGATSSDATSYTWVFDNMSAQAAKEFCFKDNECHSTAKIKPNMDYVTYAGDTYCTMGNSGASNYNFTLTTGDKYDVTITVTYGSGIHVTATAATPTPEIISIAVSPAHPTAGQTVTVTPTIAHATGSEVLCWSVVGQSIDFTDLHNGSYTFTAPADGSYQIKLELHESSCMGTLIDEATQPLRVGAFIIIYAGMEAGWHDWNGIKACVGNGTAGTGDHTALVGVDLGEASDGRHWFRFTLPTTDTHESLVLYNSVDEWPSTGIGSARTATLPKPTEDICYLVRSEKTSPYDNRRVDVGECPSEASVMITSSNHVVQNGTYTITARTIMIPGTVTYSYTVTDPSHNPVEVSGDGKFTATAIGTYTVVVTATGDGGVSATSDPKEVVCEEASLTASVSPDATSAGATVELTATPTGFGTPDYQWFVQKPGSATYVEMDGYTEVSGKYVPNQTGSYVFQVKATENGVTKQATCTLTVSAQNYYLKHDTGSGWVCNQMNYNESEGNYWIKAIYNGDGINIHTECSNTYGVMPYYRFVEEADNFTFEGGKDTYTAGDEVFYFFNPMTTHITVQKANANSYRIVSTSTKGEFYSNTVVLADATEQKEVSFFFAQDNGNLKLQKFGETGWVDQSLSLSTSAFTSDNVYKANLDLTSGLTSVKVYSGYYYIFSELGSLNECTNDNKMTAFNNINEEEYYNHYWCKWTEAEKNTSATVGNEINHNLANALSSDTQSMMSVRYAYKPETNHFSRAYLRGSQDDDDFLKVFGENIKAENGTVLNSLANSQVFMDGSDWVYTTYVKAAAAAYIKLVAHMQDDEYNYLLSASGSKDAKRNIYGVEGDFADELRFAIIYDFKTNRVISAWSPTGEEEFDHPVTVDADLLVVRKAINNSGITIFTLTGEGQVKLIRKIYTAIELNRDDIFESNKSYKSGLDRRLFQLSLPYDLDLLDVTGFLDYGTKMNLQVYSGELRAFLGWQTYIETFWSNMAYQSTSKIQAQRGYVIQHSLAYDDFKTSGDVSRITLYFPSKTNPEGYIIGPTSRYETSAFAPLTCTKPGRDKIDSNWRCIGLPGFYPASAVAVDPESITGGTNDPATNIVTEFTTPRWVYDWNGSYMSYTAYRATNFRFMPTQNYMMQYAGSITWGDAVGSNTGGTTVYPSTEVAARHAAVSEQSEGEYCLRLTDESGEMLDQTFVVLDHKASDAYEMNMDLQKMVTNGAPQIFSAVGDHSLAAAAVCDTTTHIALGTNIPDGALYTFSLGEMTPNARVPYLYDAMTGTYTNLATDSYVFSETIGKQQGRFFLVFGYQAPQTPTGLDNVVNGFSATIVDGRVVLNGLTNDLVSLYDAAGRMLYEQHLGGNNTIALPMVGGVYLVRNGANTAKIVIR